MNSSAKGKEILKILDKEFPGGMKDNQAVAASNLKPLLLHYLKDKSLKDVVSKIRDVEYNVRNLAAHEIVSITEASLKKILGSSLTIEQIFDLIKRLVTAAGITTNKEDWDSYDEMNEDMMEELLKE